MYRFFFEANERNLNSHQVTSFPAIIVRYVRMSNTNASSVQSYISKVLQTLTIYCVDCVCSEISNYGLNHGLLFSLFKFLA